LIAQYVLLKAKITEWRALIDPQLADHRPPC
jgi:hypothetical protein